MATLYSMVNETGNRKQIFGMCKFLIRFRLLHCGTITSVTRYGFRQILHADQYCDEFYIWCFGKHKPEVESDFRGVRIRIFVALGSGHHIFQRIGTKFLTEFKLSNADFVFNDKWDRKYKSDFRDVQIPFVVSISALWNDYGQNSLPIFTKLCMRLRNVVASTPTVCETNRK